MRLLFALCLTALLTSCGAQRTGEPVLQKYDGLGRSLKAVSRDVRTVTRDMSRLGHGMRTGDEQAVRTAAGRLEVDGRRLEEQARAAARGLRGLVRAEHRTVVEHYFTLTMTALGWQMREGRDLRALAGLLRADPLLTEVPDEAALRRRVGAAKHDAWMSVVADRLALRIRHSYSRSFRYRIVHLASPASKPAQQG